MDDLTLTFTNAGIAEVVNAQNNGFRPVLVSEIGIGTGQYTPSATQTSLQNEIKRLSTFSGGAVADDVVHVTIRDDSDDVYQLYEFGLYLDSGTLLAVYSQTGSPVLDKTADSILLLASDIVVTSFQASSLTFGDTNFLVAQASETEVGVVELPTKSEAEGGTDHQRAMTPLRSKQLIVYETPNIADKDYRDPLFSATTLSVHQKYHIVSDSTFTLPAVSGLVGGDTIVVTKSVYNEPKFKGANNELIRTLNGNVTTYTFNNATELVFVFNGTDWEVCTENKGLYGFLLGESGGKTNYQVLPSGMIMQWGRTISSLSGPVNVNFPIAFNNKSYSIFGVPMTTDIETPPHFTNLYLSEINDPNRPRTETQFSLSCLDDTGISISVGTFWIAIGI